MLADRKQELFPPHLSLCGAQRPIFWPFTADMVSGVEVECLAHHLCSNKCFFLLRLAAAHFIWPTVDYHVLRWPIFWSSEDVFFSPLRGYMRGMAAHLQAPAQVRAGCSGPSSLAVRCGRPRGIRP